MTFTFVLISAEDYAEEHPNTFELGPREKREQLRVGMFAKLLFAELPIRDRLRTERAWVKITERREDPLTYIGETVDDMVIVDTGTEVSFGPEHVFEWDVPAQLGKVRR